MDRAGGSCWPSLETQAEETGLHRSTVARALRRLEDAEYLTRVRGGGRTSSGKGIPTNYYARFPWDEQSHTATVSREEQSRGISATVAQDAPNSRTGHPEQSHRATQALQELDTNSSVALHVGQQSHETTVDNEQEIPKPRSKEEQLAWLKAEIKHDQERAGTDSPRELPAGDKDFADAWFETEKATG
jgi:DNA-binding transcriptional MocR family regulator